MIRMPDGVVTVHLDGERFRGAYYFRGDDLIRQAGSQPPTIHPFAGLSGEAVGVRMRPTCEFAIATVTDHSTLARWLVSDARDNRA
ncbi:MAG: hypothetical protein ACI88G_002421, partial [Woeseiaceae bacterium]